MPAGMTILPIRVRKFQAIQLSIPYADFINTPVSGSKCHVH